MDRSHARRRGRELRHRDGRGRGLSRARVRVPVRRQRRQQHGDSHVRVRIPAVRRRKDQPRPRAGHAAAPRGAEHAGARVRAASRDGRRAGTLQPGQGRDRRQRGPAARAHHARRLHGAARADPGRPLLAQRPAGAVAELDLRRRAAQRLGRAARGPDEGRQRVEPELDADLGLGQQPVPGGRHAHVVQGLSRQHVRVRLLPGCFLHRCALQGDHEHAGAAQRERDGERVEGRHRARDRQPARALLGARGGAAVRRSPARASAGRCR